MNTFAKKCAATVTALALSYVAVGETTASAYNTGQHFVVTERALRRFNFKLGSLQWIEAAGYTVDEAANYPDKAMFEGGDAQRSKNIAHYFHYDALNGPRSVERELAWQRIAVATVVRAAAQRRDPQTILHVIGIMSHAIQDFYSHSNFADFDWVGLRGYRIVTIDDVQRDTWDSPALLPRWGSPQDAFKGLLSGKPSQPPYSILLSNYPGHGGEPTCNEATRDCFNPDGGGIGLNHDSVPRRNSLTSLLMAQEATSDLVDRVKELVNDASLWQAVIDNTSHGEGVVDAWVRANALSRASGQWGYPHPQNTIQIGLATLGTVCFGDCATWVNGWQKTLADLFLAAPPGFATGGGAPRFPPLSTPIFELPSTPIGDSGVFAGTYSVSWGDKTGTFELGTAPPSQPLRGKMTLGGTPYSITSFRPRGNGFDIDAIHAVTGATRLTGTIYPIGPATALQRQFSGYLRDERGIPEGFAIKKNLVDRPVPAPPVAK